MARKSKDDQIKELKEELKKAQKEAEMQKLWKKNAGWSKCHREVLRKEWHGLRKNDGANDMDRIGADELWQELLGYL